MTQQEALADHEIARRATRGAATYLVRSTAGQVAQAISALAVSRVLLPREYGVIALSLTLVGAVRWAADLGITYALTVKREVEESQLRIDAAVTLIVAVLGGGLIAAIWPQLSLVREVGSTAVWMGLAMATVPLLAVPWVPAQVVMERELRFSELGRISLVATLLLFTTQVVLLLLGFGMWSMAIAQMVGAATTTVLTVRAVGRLYVPSLKGGAPALVREGLPYQGSVIAVALTGTVVNILVAAQLGARGIGLFAWCTILATPVLAGLSSVHQVAAPTLARMRRDDGRRYDESVGVLMRTLVAIAAVAAGCLIGVTSPTIRFVFAERWLPATSAVQICLAGVMVTAIQAVLVSDANARQMRRTTLVSSIAGAVATLAALWPLAAAGGVGGAAVAAYLIGPAVAVGVFVWATRPPIAKPVWTAIRLFVPLLALSFGLGHFIHTPVELAASCALIAAAGAGLAYVVEGRLAMRILRLLRTTTGRVGESTSPAVAVSGSVGGS